MKLFILLTMVTLGISAQESTPNCHYELRYTNEEDYCTQGGCRYKQKRVLVCNEYQCTQTRVVYDNSDPARAEIEDDCRIGPVGACM